ncbi:hypothetical protein VTJ04DRAFT_8406 [Mycothermus thermophilus]|uniref:uncharacterized protein n=1 Tax=Humicola insolens TaxID=85995 RepID=UPI0037422857
MTQQPEAKKYILRQIRHSTPSENPGSENPTSTHPKSRLDHGCRFGGAKRCCLHSSYSTRGRASGTPAHAPHARIRPKTGRFAAALAGGDQDAY